jgi:hypothetical protein
MFTGQSGLKCSFLGNHEKTIINGSPAKSGICMRDSIFLAFFTHLEPSNYDVTITKIKFVQFTTPSPVTRTFGRNDTVTPFCLSHDSRAPPLSMPPTTA